MGVSGIYSLLRPISGLSKPSLAYQSLLWPVLEFSCQSLRWPVSGMPKLSLAYLWHAKAFSGLSLACQSLLWPISGLPKPSLAYLWSAKSSRMSIFHDVSNKDRKIIRHRVCQARWVLKRIHESSFPHNTLIWFNSTLPSEMPQVTETTIETSCIGQTG